MISLRFLTVAIVFCIFSKFLISFGATTTIGNLNTGPKIINGTIAERNVTKHQVSIRRKLLDSYYFGSGHICGGSLISYSVVLSAAHCFVTQDSGETVYTTSHDFIVVMGNLDRFLLNNDTLSYNISHIIYAAPKFNLSTYETDIALLFLRGMVPESHPFVQPILLNHQPLLDGTICNVTGWGNTEEGSLSQFLMSVEVPIISKKICTTETNFTAGQIRDGMLCAGYMEGERDACGGDSGGPLVCNNVLAGIVSWGQGCALPLLPGVYTDVAFYVPWIKAQIKAAGGSLPGGSSSNFRASFTIIVMLASIVILFKNKNLIV